MKDGEKFTGVLETVLKKSGKKARIQYKEGELVKSVLTNPDTAETLLEKVFSKNEVGDTIVKILEAGKEVREVNIAEVYSNPDKFKEIFEKSMRLSKSEIAEPAKFIKRCNNLLKSLDKIKEKNGGVETPDFAKTRAEIEELLKYLNEQKQQVKITTTLIS